MFINSWRDLAGRSTRSGSSKEPSVSDDCSAVRTVCSGRVCCRCWVSITANLVEIERRETSKQQTTQLFVVQKIKHHNNCLTALYLGHLCEPAPELSETLTQYTTFVVFKFLTITPNHPSRPPSLRLGSSTNDNPEETRTVLTRRVSSYGLPAALSDYGVNAAGIAEIVVIFRNDSSLAEMPGSFA